MSGSPAWMVNGEKMPAKANTLASVISFWMRALPRTGSNWSSSTRSSRRLPVTPPAWFTSERTAWTPCIIAVPTEPSGPDRGNTPPRRRTSGPAGRPAGGPGGAAAVRPPGGGAGRGAPAVAGGAAGFASLRGEPVVDGPGRGEAAAPDGLGASVAGEAGPGGAAAPPAVPGGAGGATAAGGSPPPAVAVEGTVAASSSLPPGDAVPERSDPPQAVPMRAMSTTQASARRRVGVMESPVQSVR